MGVGKLFIKDLREGDYVRSNFMVSDRNLTSFKEKNGSFLNITLTDKTGEISAIAWENGAEFFKISNPGDVVGVGGTIKRYKGNLQIVVEELWKCKEGEYELEDFIPSTEADVGELKKFLVNVISQIREPHLKGVLEYFFSNPAWFERFARAPAAKKIHHGYLGGLIEHTVSVIRLCQVVCEIYPNVNRDLLLTGAILHDIGKVEEYVFDRKIDLSDEGRLLGHITLGERMVGDAIKTLRFFPRDLEVALRHMILSHHGEYEWGSPKRPKFLEACILHHLDNLDAQVHKFTRLIEEDQDDGDNWTAYDATLGRSLYIGVHRMTSFSEGLIRAGDESAAGRAIEEGEKRGFEPEENTR